MNKIIYYLIFAKSKLNNNILAHRKAKEEIDKIIGELKQEVMEEENINHIPVI